MDREAKGDLFVQTLRRHTALFLATILIAVAGALALPKSASATNGWNYISLPTWLGSCPGGGHVVYLFVAVGNTWSGGDGGDDLVYARVALNQNQTVSAQGLCYNGRFSYWGPASSNTIHPTRNNQTWWVGPWGVRHN